ncbi:Acg family FMN-binding oxidoreductase [Dactylosporangium sp. CA-052675]|uniref:Acg family FMN-binding oxidoreductase n=1 Tax=Dactylosporangium sp. CA-052675 TaxID=3239927 RepID=UPI003D90E1F6
MHTALLRAARDARLAPSILNSQPWRWRTGGSALELHADPARQLPHIDPHGRLMIISCGAALHHARVALSAAGHEPVVDRMPDPGRPTLLARIVAGAARPPTSESLAAYDSMRRRRTERRPFPADARVPAEALTRMRAAAEAERAHLYVLDSPDVEYLRYAAQGAHTITAHDTLAAAELRQWTHRDNATDGVPPATVVPAVPRPVPMRDFGLGAEAELPPGSGDDAGAEYLVVATSGDEPADWLGAGEATSAAWLTATTEGLGASPMSEVVEIPGARVLVRTLLPTREQPQLVLRVGVPPASGPPPSPRRPAAGIVTEG